MEKEEIRNSIIKTRFRIDAYFYVGLMLILVLARLLFEINIPVVVLLVVSIFPLLFGNLDDIIAFAICCIPLSSSFQYKYALFIYLIVLILRGNYKLKVSSGGIAVLIMMMWELMHIVFGSFSINEYFRDFAELLLLLVILTMDISSLNYKKIIRVFAFATVGICLIMLLLQLKQFNYNFNLVFSRGFRNYRFGTRNTFQTNFGLNFNSNRLGFICNLTNAGLLVLFGRRENTKIDSVLLFFSVTFGLLTLSRTYILCLLIMLAFFVFSIRGSLSRRIRTFVGITLGIAIIAVVFINVFPNEVTNFIERFTEEDIGNGRAELLQYYHNHIWSSPLYFLFGVGLQNYGLKVSSIHGSLMNVCHNGYQEIVVCWGIFGLVLVAILIVDIIKRSYVNSHNDHTLYYLPLILIGISTFAGQFISSEVVLMGLIFSYLILYIPEMAIQQIKYNDTNM